MMPNTIDKVARAMSESSIKRTIQHWLDVQMAQGLLWWCRVNSGSLLVAGPNEKRYRVQLAPEGTADILVLQGHMLNVDQVKASVMFTDVYWIETKRPRRGKQSEMQAEFQRRVEAEGCYYILARCFEDVEKVLGGME